MHINNKNLPIYLIVLKQMMMVAEPAAAAERRARSQPLLYHKM